MMGRENLAGQVEEECPRAGKPDSSSFFWSRSHRKTLPELGVKCRSLNFIPQYCFCSLFNLPDFTDPLPGIILILVTKGSIKFSQLLWCSLL